MAAVNSCCQAPVQGQATGRCRVLRRAEVATRAGTVISWARMVARVALACVTEASAPSARVRIDRHRCEYQPGGVGGEPPGGQVRQRAVLQVSDHLLDDGL